MRTDREASPAAVIRPAVPEDLGSAYGIVRAATAHMDAQGVHQWDEVYPDRDLLRDDIEGGCMLLVEVGERVAGIVVLDEEQPDEYSEIAWLHGGRILVVHRLTIHPDFQRRGLARRLMEHAESLAAGRGYDAIRLDAFAPNHASIALYERLGYRSAGTLSFRKGLFHGFEKPVGGG